MQRRFPTGTWKGHGGGAFRGSGGWQGGHGFGRGYYGSAGLLRAAVAALPLAYSTHPWDGVPFTVHAHLLSGKPLVARVLHRLGMKSDTAMLQTESRWGRSEEVLPWSMSKAT